MGNRSGPGGLDPGGQATTGVTMPAVAACHVPVAVAVGMPRLFSSAATPLSEVMPAPAMLRGLRVGADAAGASSSGRSNRLAVMVFDVSGPPT
jgi:hypothetical protein